MIGFEQTLIDCIEGCPNVVANPFGHFQCRENCIKTVGSEHLADQAKLQDVATTAKNVKTASIVWAIVLILIVTAIAWYLLKKK